MDCNKIKVRSREIEKLARQIWRDVQNADSTSALNALNVIAAHVSGIRAELESVS